MRKVSIPLIDKVRPFLLGMAGVALLAGFLTYRLGDLTGGVSPAEAPTVQVVQGRALGLERIAEESLFLPHQLGIYALEKTGFTSVGAIRGVGVLFGLAGAVGFYLILKKWHTRRVAVLGTGLLATSSWFLHTSRLAVPESSYLLLPVFLYAAIKLDDGESSFKVLVVSFLATILMLYLPGLVWFIIPMLIWQRRKIIRRLQEVNPLGLSLLAGLTLILLIPLIYTFYSNPDFLKTWLGYNVGGLNIPDFFKNLVLTPFHIFMRSESLPHHHLGRLPYLDAATSIFTMLGVYWYFFQRKLDRTRLIIGGFIVGDVIVALYGIGAETLLMPLVYMVAAAGLTLMLQRWFTVFPRNPLARGIGIGLIFITVGIIAFYHARRYFVAWPNTPATKQIFTTQP